MPQNEPSHPTPLDLVLDAVIEIPKGSRTKYEVDHASGRIRLDRMLFTATRYPSDYGFFPDTLAEDGDPLDVLVLVDEATFPGCIVAVRPIALFLMTDEHGPDAKILAVPASDPRFQHYQDLDDVDPFRLAEIWHFFQTYKQIEPGKRTETAGWRRCASAVSATVAAQRRHTAADDDDRR